MYVCIIRFLFYFRAYILQAGTQDKTHKNGNPDSPESPQTPTEEEPDMGSPTAITLSQSEEAFCSKSAMVSGGILELIERVLLTNSFPHHLAGLCVCVCVCVCVVLCAVTIFTHFSTRQEISKFIFENIVNQLVGCLFASLTQGDGGRVGAINVAILTSRSYRAQFKQQSPARYNTEQLSHSLTHSLTHCTKQPGESRG